jgi:hypothetical protein
LLQLIMLTRWSQEVIRDGDSAAIQSNILLKEEVNTYDSISGYIDTG